MSETEGLKRFFGAKNYVQLETNIQVPVVKSEPPVDCKKVVNIYVEMVEGQPKLRVEYEE